MTNGQYVQIKHLYHCCNNCFGSFTRTEPETNHRKVSILYYEQRIKYIFICYLELVPLISSILPDVAIPVEPFNKSFDEVPKLLFFFKIFGGH